MKNISVFSFLGLFSFLFVLKLNAVAQTGLTQIELAPAAPATRDTVMLKLSGEWSDACVPRNPSVSVSNNRITLMSANPSGGCATVITPFNFSVTVGPLAEGVYEIVALHSAAGALPREFARKTFTVGTISDGVFPLLWRRTLYNRIGFYVFQDADSGINRGYPSGFFGQIEKLSLDAACVNDPAAANGCAPAGATRLDRVRGNVMRLTFASLSAGQFVGVNFEEPENWAANFKPPSRGYDLRGATEIVFEVRSPTGIRVQFGVGERVTEFRTFQPSQNFETVRIPLNSLRDPSSGAISPPDLSAVHILFAVAVNVFNTPNGGTLLLDNIRFEPVPASVQNEISFPLGNQTFGVVPQLEKASGRVPIPSDQVLRNLTTTYESALTLLTLLQRGQPQDLSAARVIADAFHYSLQHDNSGLPLPKSSDGSVGWRNAYENGPQGLFNDQPQPGAKAGEMRLAGFSASPSLCGPTGYCLVLDGAYGGNEAFAILAMIAAGLRLNQPTYLADAEKVGRWMIEKLTDRTGTGYGGYYLGYPDEGVPAPKPLLTGKSIENNADLAAAFYYLALLAKQQGRLSDAAFWQERSNIAGDFVMAMYDAERGRFFGGTVPVGLPASSGICPDGPRKGNDVINTCDFLDSNSFTILALASLPRYRNRIDWRKPTQYMLDNFAQTVTANQQEYRGFNIVKAPTAGPNGVAWEFTAQAVVVFRLIDSLCGESRFAASANAYLEQLRRAQNLAPFGDGQGLVAATLQNGDQLPPLEQCLSTPFQCIAQRSGLAASTWAAMAERNFNTLAWPWPCYPVSAASFNGTQLAPDSIASVFGATLANNIAVSNSAPLPTTLGGSTIRVRDSANVERLAQLFFVSPAQINFLLPVGTALGEAIVTVTNSEGVPSISTIMVSSVAPGLFAANGDGQGVAAAVALRVKANGTLTYEAIARFDTAQNKFVPSAIDLGEATDQLFLSLYGTGTRGRSVTASIGGVNAEVLYAGKQGDFVGLDQLNLRIPRSLIGRGEVNVAVTVDGLAANIVTVSIR
ncbi:MAG: hypothetical protein HOP19_17445 [Acidobacteria bacterium]|nr:hypothetical protein [Acidobacteriota bacterium]